MHMCRETRGRYGHRMLSLHPSSLQRGFLTDPEAHCSSWTGCQHPRRVSCFCLSRLKLHFSKSWSWVLGIQTLAFMVVHQTFHPLSGSPQAPDSDVFTNKDCSLGCLCSQPIQNVWGRLLRSADTDGVLTYLRPPLHLLPRPPSLPAYYGSLQKVAFDCRGRTTQP